MKTPVYFSHYLAVDTGLKAPAIPISSPLARRFSPIQKAVFECFESIKCEAPDDFNLVLKEWHAPLYFATSLGEIDSVIRVIRGVLENDLPVSPIAFQHSVHNAAAGHISIHYGLKSPQLTFSSGYLSLEKAMFSAYHKILMKSVSAVCMVAADEYRTNSGLAARAEVFFLSGKPLQNSKINYQILDYQYGELKDSHKIDNQVHFKEADMLESCRLDLPNSKKDFIRLVEDRGGEKLSSSWKFLS